MMPQIKQGYRTGLLGRTIEMHALYYSKLVGFGLKFETKVASEYAQFLTGIENENNCVWYVEDDGTIVGNLVIDGELNGGQEAVLRWFILDDRLHGKGIGNQMMAKACRFCDSRGFAQTSLWTFAGLDAARQLYEKSGFELVLEQPGSSWGKQVLEQKFVRKAQKA